MFIDMHCHILPGIDDGAESFKKSCDLIMQASSCGSTVITVTPHYNNRAKCASVCTKNHIVDVYKSLKNYIFDMDIPVNILLGSEMLVNDNIDFLYKHDELITLNGSRYILVEFPFDENIVNINSGIEKLLSWGLIPVIAHPERYLVFENNPQELIGLFNKDCKLQINKDSPLGKYGSASQASAIWLLKNDMVHLIASDCHDISHRNADMGDIYTWMLDRFPQKKIMQLMHDNPKRILLDEAI